MKYFKKITLYKNGSSEYLLERRVVSKMKFGAEYDQIIDYILLNHWGQKRRFDKTPYMYHPARVAKLLIDMKMNKKIIHAAFLHDVIEDTKSNWIDIRNEFGEDVANLVQELTSDEAEIKKSNKTDYLIQKLLKMSDDALTIKLADRLDNIQDFDTATDKFIKKYAPSTKLIVMSIQKRNLNKTHSILIGKINKILVEYDSGNIQ